VSRWTPIRWGALEAVRGVLGWRGAAALGLATQVLLNTQERDRSLPLLVALLGPALLLGLAPPSGSALTSRSASGWASLSGGLLRAALAMVLAVPLYAVTPGPDSLWAMGGWLSFVASAALVSGALRLAVRERPAAAAVAAPLCVGALWWGALALGVEFWMRGPMVLAMLLSAPAVVGLLAHAVASFVRPPVAPRPSLSDAARSLQGPALVRRDDARQTRGETQ
jgi:hypothetical protein